MVFEYVLRLVAAVRYFCICFKVCLVNIGKRLKAKDETGQFPWAFKNFNHDGSVIRLQRRHQTTLVNGTRH